MNFNLNSLQDGLYSRLYRRSIFGVIKGDARIAHIMLTSGSKFKVSLVNWTH